MRQFAVCVWKQSFSDRLPQCWLYALDRKYRDSGLHPKVARTYSAGLGVEPLVGKTRVLWRKSYCLTMAEAVDEARRFQQAREIAMTAPAR